MTILHPSPEMSSDCNGLFVAQSLQYQAPELLVRMPAAEYLLPCDASFDSHASSAVAIANGDVDHPLCLKRYTENGGLFVEANSYWLETLV